MKPLGCSVIAVLALYFTASLAPGTEPEKPVSDCIAAVEHALDESKFLEKHPDFKITKDGRQLELSYHAREWLVYNCGMDGRWRDNPGKEIGPNSDGMIITFWFTPSAKDAIDQWAGRRRLLDLKGMGEQSESGNFNIISHPYWKVYGCGASLPEQKVNIRANVAFNLRTDQKLLEEAFAVIASAFNGKTAPFNPVP